MYSRKTARPAGEKYAEPADGPAHPAGPASHHYGRLVAASVAAAVMIAGGLALLRPLPEPPPEDPFAGTGAAAPSPLPDPVSSISLPAAPAEAGAEELRGALLQVGQELLARFADSSEALHVVALLYADLQMTTEAEPLWQKCISMTPQHPGPYLGLATAAMELGKDELAVQTLREARAKGCSSADLHHQLAAALTKLGRLDEAEAVIREGLTAFPLAAENWLQLGQVQTQLGRFPEAEASLQQAIQQGSTSGTVWFALATVSARQGKTEEAAKYRQVFSEVKAAAQAGADDRFQARYDTEMRRIAVATLCRAAAVVDRAALAAADAKQHESLLADSERYLLRALALDPAHAVVCNELAMFYRRAGRVADARLVQQRLVELDPDNVLHRANLASLCSQLGDLSTAEAMLKEVVSLRPDMAIGYSGLAQLSLQTGKFEQARWFAEAALRQTPLDASEPVRNQVLLATACRALGDRPAAEAALAAARRLAPDDPRLQQFPDSPQGEQTR